MAKKIPPIDKGALPLTIGQNRWPFALLGIAVFMVFSQVCGHEFLTYDDNQNITQNELVTALTPANLLHFWQKPFAGMYIPLTYTFWSLQAQVASLLPPGQESELNPYLFHTVNLLLHLANACLVLLIIRRFVRHDWASLLGALLFAVHPVQVEPVAWVTGCKDLLSAFFSLLALNLYLTYAQSQPAGSKRKTSYLLGLGCFAAALLAKPSAVVVPLVAGGMGLLLLHKNTKQLAGDLAPWALLVAPIAIMTRISQTEASQSYLPTLWQRLLISGDTLSFYVLKLLAPLHLGPDYGRTPQFVLQHDWLYLSGILPYLVIGLCLWKSTSTYRAAIGIFVCSLLPVLGLFSFSFQLVSTVADRYLYLALLGPALAMSWFMAQTKGKWAWGIGVTLLALFAVKSVSQVPTWSDTITFNQHAITVNPQSWTAYGNLGNAMADSDRQQEAVALYQQALTIKPDEAKTTFNLGISYSMLQQTEAAIAAFTKTVEIINSHDNPDPAYKIYKAEALRDSYLNLALVYDTIKQPDQAIAYYQKTIAIDPSFTVAYANLGVLYAERGSLDEAITMHQKALALDPLIKGFHGNLGLLLAQQGNLPAAVKHFNQALAQTPNDLPVRLNLGLALSHQKEYDEARRHFLQVIAAEQAPIDLSAEAAISLGEVYMAQGRWQEASDSFRMALRQAPNHPYAKENLQKSLAEMEKMK